MSGAGAAVGLILGGWLTGTHLDLGRPRHRRLAADLPDQRADRPGRRPAGAALARRVRVAPRRARPARAPSPAPWACSASSTASPAPATAHGWSDTWTIAQPGRRRRAAGRVRRRRGRVKHPLLPFRVLANRTRATSFVTMMLVPAAMFAMFFFLSLFVQNVMGYSPLKAGFAFLPFCFGIVVAATISSKLVAGRPALPRGHRHRAGRGRAVRVLADAVRRLARPRRRPGAATGPTSCRSS